MSRRREAAELARALALSTQEATNISRVSPHTLSSSKSDTQDSREMELKTVTPVLPRSTSASDLPPVVRTYAQDTTSSTPRYMPYASSMVDPIISAKTPSNSNRELSSHIQSFTPTRTPQSNPSLPPHVPATSSNSGDPSITPASALPAQSSSSKSKPPFSSPNVPIPSSRLSGDKSHVSSSGSSHRPLFSPTQMSSHPSDPPVPSANAVVPTRNLVTYGQSRNPSPAKSAAVPVLTMARGHSPLKLSGPPLVHQPSRFVLSQTPEGEEEEEEELVEERPSAKATTASEIEVLLPVRERSTSRVPPPHSRSAGSHSPDPLDSNIERGISNTPSNPPSSNRVSVKSSMKTPNVASSSKSKTPGTVMTETQESDKTSGPSRISARQQSRKEKEEKEKEARREARRIRKEKERLEQESKENPGREDKSIVSRTNKRSRGEVNESIIVLDPPVNMTNSRASRRTRDVSRSPEIIELLDETLQVHFAAANAAKEAYSIEGRGGKIDLDEQQREPARRATPKPATQKKRKRAGEDDEDDEAEDWHDEEEKDAQVKTKTMPKKVVVPKKDDKRKPAKITGRSKADPKPAQVFDQDMEPETDVMDAEEGDNVTRASEQDNIADKVDDETEQADILLSPTKSVAESALTMSTQSTTTPAPATVLRSPLKAKPSMINTASPSYRASPGPSNIPGGVKWKTARNDLAAVLTKFGGARQSGMSKRNKIVPLHMKIGPPVKALPPPPPKPSKKKKDESDEEDSDEAEMESDGEGGLKKKKKEKGIEWYMMED